MASSEDRAAAIARVHSSARKASAWLLRIGTAPFAAHTLLLATDLLPVHLLSESMRPPLEIALVCHAGTIIAFIGGLQQAVAVGEGGAQLGRHSATVAVTAIFAAISGCLAIFSVAVRQRPPTIELAFLAGAYTLVRGSERPRAPSTRPSKHACALAS